MKAIFALCVIAAAMYTVASECGCQLNVDKVCGVDGTFYQNECFLNCAGVAKYTGPGLECPCPTPRAFFHICGSDGKVYSSVEEMACYNVEPAADASICPTQQPLFK